MKNLSLWLLAFIITISSAAYQRMTGPTYPLRGQVSLDESVIKYKLARSHGGDQNHVHGGRIPDRPVDNRFHERTVP